MNFYAFCVNEWRQQSLQVKGQIWNERGVTEESYMFLFCLFVLVGARFCLLLVFLVRVSC